MELVNYNKSLGVFSLFLVTGDRERGGGWHSTQAFEPCVTQQPVHTHFHQSFLLPLKIEI